MFVNLHVHNFYKIPCSVVMSVALCIVFTHFLVNNGKHPVQTGDALLQHRYLPLYKLERGGGGGREEEEWGWITLCPDIRVYTLPLLCSQSPLSVSLCTVVPCS